MTNLPSNLTVTLMIVRARLSTALRDQRGEGVISTAIAVMIMAFLGAAMWVAFNSIWSDSEVRIRDNVEQIGSGA
jgi:hypothetical protein